MCECFLVSNFIARRRCVVSFFSSKSALRSACGRHCNTQLAKLDFDEIFDSTAGDMPHITLLANINEENIVGRATIPDERDAMSWLTTEAQMVHHARISS